MCIKNQQVGKEMVCKLEKESINLLNVFSKVFRGGKNVK
ncbi:hypothetical protein N499_0139 [Wolbachia pipientis wVitA]|nr:hypothetical protein N499_0139 [Wolbachia pipientis wVitA]